MFKSVIERQRAGRLGLGLWWSVAIHAGLFGAVLVISARPADVPPEAEFNGPLVLKLAPGPQVAKGYTAPAPAQAKQAVQPKPRKPRRDVIPTQIQPLPADPQPAQPDPVDTTSNTNNAPVGEPGEGVAGGHPDGDPNSNVISGTLITGLPSDFGAGTGEDVVPFGGGMTPPVLMEGPPLEYTDQARVARVEGTFIAKCVITREGLVRDCRVIKGLAHMNDETLNSLHHRRYTPVTFQGRATSVSYVFTLRFKLPR
ncbi:TonB domain-containing protein [Myxococcus stipitatus DSM 14675]|uniref:TonB domain-containing protein n=1 Tax=Myxococcus stipitatus (strain DSM 14675 / JCM 12634 / Mx s8) TaxID=1278073 RepID=L7UDI7_MYXSD|nr:energy transducer TonB [Myxococcus stipitatus]AGC44514.1 TonB domain-containing protein [Myxococcus stipitatus DSM 14675]